MPDQIKVYVINVGRKHYSLRWHDPDLKKDRWRTSGCTTKRAAERVAADLEKQLNANRSTAGGDLRWALYELKDADKKDAPPVFMELYQQRQLSGMDLPTHKWHLAKLNVFTKEMKPQRIGDITSVKISQYIAWLRGQGRKDPTIRGHMIALNCAFDWAKSQGYIHEIPTIPTIKLNRKNKSKGRALEFWEFIRMLRAVTVVMQPQQVESWRHFLIGLWLSGLRLAEAAALSWNDPTGPRISFAEEYPTLEIEVEDDKGREYRLMPITPDFARWLARTPKEERHGPIFRPLGQDGQVITNETNLSRTISTFGETAKIVVNARQKKFASAHDLRRTYGTRWAPEVPTVVLKELMRHKSITTTEEYYLGLKAQAMAKELWKKVARKVAPPPDDSKSA